MGFLANVKEGKIEEPVSVIVYGVDGIGKSTFGAESPAPLFLAAEHGTSQMDVARIPNIKTFKDCREVVNELTDAKSLKYKTLVLDTLDWIEPLIWEEVCNEYKPKVNHISKIGYNKGYDAAIGKQREFILMLANLRAKKNINLVFLAHSKIKRFDDPSAPSGWDRYQLALRDDAANLWRQSVDAVLFLNYVVYKANEDDIRAQGEGERVMFTEERPSYNAKNRYGLPHRIPMKLGYMWEGFFGSMKDAAKTNNQDLIKDIEELRSYIPSASDEDKALHGRIDAALKNAGNDVSLLLPIKERLMQIVNVK